MTQKNISIERVLERVQTLPPLPSAISKLYQLTGNPRTNAKELARVISLDQVMTARILRYANSAYYGLVRRVSTVSHAIMIIGFNGVRDLALGFSVFGFQSKKQKNAPINIEDFWRHSLAVASAARLIAIHLRLSNPEEAFVVGLMHDIGRIVFTEHYADHYIKLISESQEKGIPLYDLERDFFGIDHASLGRALCEYWNLPVVLSQSIGRHHTHVFGEVDKRKQKGLRVDQETIERELMVMAVVAAETLAKLAQLGFSGDVHLTTEILELITTKKINTKQLREIYIALPEEVRTVESFFNLSKVEEASEEASLEEDLPLVGVVLENMGMVEAISLYLLGRNIKPVPPEQLINNIESMVAVIADESMSPDMRHRLISLNIPVINFEEWHGKQDIHYPGCINAPKFLSWLSRKLYESMLVAETIKDGDSSDK